MTESVQESGAAEVAAPGQSGFTYFRANSLAADASATGTDTVAIGPRAVSESTNSVALGLDARAIGEGNSVSVGYRASSFNTSTIAIGADAKALARGDVAIGYLAVAGEADGVALGGNASSQGELSTVLGAHGTAFGLGSVALGAQSVADDDYVVSVGNAQRQRPIVNVAPGALSATSNEAVTGSQLHATQQEAEKLAADVAALQSDTASTPYFLVGSKEVNPGADRTMVTVGPEAVAHQSGSIAIGHLASASGDIDAIAIGRNSSSALHYAIALGTDTVVFNVAAIGIGLQAKATGVRSIALGAYSNVTGKRSVALGESSVADRDDSVSVGSPDRQRTVAYMAAGILTQDSTDGVNGSQLYATNLAVTNLMQQSVAQRQQLDTLKASLADSKRDLDLLRRRIAALEANG
ncbi:hypothetical protein [Cupriavidus agavae]|uniref:Trimeric autotransporter adhesin n=1 Tax=Cupriavidus agavae TaxID=1001822 RepID=A0A4Q7RX24_9BURK|nr:hypothetical protein [Cupriavidus agavae]RZT38501.1 trimeric autotransporter adhesin [Cupriavidus agavae]